VGALEVDLLEAGLRHHLPHRLPHRPGRGDPDVTRLIIQVTTPYTLHPKR
jgi:hypothetical protein